MDAFFFIFVVVCLIAEARVSNTMLNNSGESGHPCLVPDLRGKALNFSPLSMMLAVGFSYMSYIKLRDIASKPTLLRVYIMNGCCTLSNAFSASNDRIIRFLSFLLLI